MNYSANDWFRQIHHSEYEISECLTVEGWINQYTDVFDGIIFQKGTSNTEGGLIVKWLDMENKLQVVYYGATTSRTVTTAVNSFNSYEWKHFSVVINLSTILVYIDGIQSGSASLTSDFQNLWANNKEDIYWATSPSQTTFMQAYFDEIRISNTCRSYSSSGSNIQEITMLVEMEEQ
jgi:hypothetical protein